MVTAIPFRGACSLMSQKSLFEPAELQAWREAADEQAKRVRPCGWRQPITGEEIFRLRMWYAQQAANRRR